MADRKCGRVCPWLLTTGLVLCACSDPHELARIGRERVRISDVEERERRARTDPEASVETQLDYLLERALLVEAARRKGLEDEPAIAARLRSSRREILAQAYLDLALTNANTDERMRERYEATRDDLARRRIHVRHVFVSMAREASGSAAVIAENRARLAYARLREGHDMAEVASELSDDPVSARNGGLLDPIREGQVDPTFFEAAVALARAEISPPVRTPFGFHVIVAEADPDQWIPTFEEVRAKLAADARREAEIELMDRLRDEIRVRRRPERIESWKKSRSQAAVPSGAEETIR